MNARETARSTGDGGVGLYVFCFARAGAAGVAVGPGLDAEAPLGARVHEEVAAICCEVPLHDWTGEAGEAHLKDVGWLGPRALRHEAIIERMMRASPVLPLRFGCLFSSAERGAARAGPRVSHGGVFNLCSRLRPERKHVELLTIQVRLVVGSVDKAVEMGMDFWKSDPHLSPLARRESPPALPASGPEELARRVAELEAVVAKLEGGNPPAAG